LTLLLGDAKATAEEASLQAGQRNEGAARDLDPQVELFMLGGV
jgi:hypothetical protein